MVIRKLAVVSPDANVHIRQPLVSSAVCNLIYIKGNLRLFAFKVCLCKLNVLQKLHIARIHYGNVATEELIQASQVHGTMEDCRLDVMDVGVRQEDLL